VTNVGARKPVVESLALSTEASRDNTGLEISFAFSVNPKVLACARRWGDPIDKLRANSTAQLNQVCAASAGCTQFRAPTRANAPTQLDSVSDPRALEAARRHRDVVAAIRDPR
jgi:hypothetical protein